MAVDFNNLSVLGEMMANNIFGDGGVFDFANVNLALFGCGLFNSHFLALDGMIKVSTSTKTTM